MPQITETSLSDSGPLLSILKQGLHGGFLDEDTLSNNEIQFCENMDWVEKVYKFKCSACGKWHTAPPGEERCLRTQEHVDVNESKNGFRVIADSRLKIGEDTGYSLFVEEATSSVNTTKLPYKSIVFIPDQEDIQFSDRAGSTVFLPLDVLPSFTDDETRTELIEEINGKRKQLVDWERLDSGGDDFEELIFRLEPLRESATPETVVISNDPTSQIYHTRECGPMTFSQGKNLSTVSIDDLDERYTWCKKCKGRPMNIEEITTHE